ncbi:hypothetical protein LCGC14_0597110 [marine sediment metagenome]|uniref:VanZ-like domain-containing protein n=1 Tax=marine sediment metagenome TaxID=412755 RepID=A0A0F9UK63_9ZZZZ
MSDLTSLSAFDQFSIGHIIFGAITFFLLLVVLGRFGKRRDRFILLITFLLTFIIAIGFEIIENSAFIVNDSGLKINNRKDSVLNSTMDIILNMIGAFIIFIIFWYILKKTNLKQDIIRLKRKIVK